MSTPSRRNFIVAAAAAAVGLGGGVALATAAPSISQALSPTSEVDIGFCTDMSAHHVQALAMCQRVLGRDTGDSVQAAAVEVLQTQAIEVGTMRAWLADWGASTASPDIVMAWMDMNFGDGIPIAAMPGFATDEQLRELSLATGMECGRLWLELMRRHHVGGVHMATAALELASEEKVRRLARVQVDVQSYEIEQYDVLLATEYA